MPEKSKNIELRSDEVQEIMSHIPSWMIRWGITLIFALILLGGFLTWFIKYPDTISGTATITTEIPTTKLVSNSSGQLILLEKENSTVEKGEVIASIHSNLSPIAKLFLESQIEELSEFMRTEKEQWEFKDEGFHFGSLQEKYEILKSTVLEFIRFKELSGLEFEIQNLNEQIRNHQLLKEVGNDQFKLEKEFITEERNQYAASERLYEKGVISGVQLFEARNKLKQAESSMTEIRKSALQSALQISELKRQLYTTQMEYKRLLNEYITKINSSISSIQNDLNGWESTYEIQSPRSGTLAYMQNLSLNQHIEQGALLFAVIPKNEDYVGNIVVSQSNYGKIKIGQTVHIKLDNYPYQEYGQLRGKVTSISLIPNEDKYRVQFKLSSGMNTTYNKAVRYTPEMSGTAEIITEDIRLLNRIINKFKKSVD